ncbi:MAG: hypothetical protein EA384_05415 [Spirochaetaceae bacterium]|nr:MAG: hypothetical protein EA384_05415 [Spirochaetaceae bacterium]
MIDQRRDDADRHQIILGPDRRGPRPGCQQRRHNIHTRFKREIALEDEVTGKRVSGFLERLREPAKTFTTQTDVQRTGHARNPAVSERAQVPCGKPTCQRIVHHDRRNRAAGQPTVQQNIWHRGCVEHIERATLIGNTDEYNPVYIAADEMIDKLCFLIGVTLCVADDQAMADLAHSLLGEVNERLKGVMRYIGNRQPDEAASLGAQTGCQQIGPVVDHPDNVFNNQPGLPVHRVGIVDNP